MPAIPTRYHAEIDGRRVEIAVRVHARARRYRLSIPVPGKPVLTLPPNGRWSEAEGFVLRHAGWLAARLARSGPATALTPGASIPLRGEPHEIVATGVVRGLVRAEAGQLLVPGTPEHVSRRLLDWLRAEAQAALEERVAHHCARLGVTAKSVRLRDQSTRWGSCSSAGRLNFNWRLILAPPFVLDYVAAHEVAHLVEMNHSPAFWDTVARTLPDMARGRAWLRAHGAGLMAIRTAPEPEPA